MHLWTRLLHAVPTSRLLLLAPNSARLRESVLSYFTRHGITPDRWTLAPRRPRPEYLQLISTVDIALDPLPFLGHTTTCDCIHMGVPVITRLGDSYLRRFGAVASRAVGLHDLVTPTDDAYLTAATNLAADLPRIAQLRSQLRTRLLDSPITQAHTFTQNLEAAYRTAWAELLNR
jgi:predicted O-linked N-acetylglucosamine transferase (SPINDLY family)